MDQDNTEQIEEISMEMTQALNQEPDMSRYQISPKGRPRDSIACFFSEAEIESQLSLLSQQSPLKPKASPKPIFSSPKPAVGSKLRYSVTADEMAMEESIDMEMETVALKNRRTSVAQFLKSPTQNLAKPFKVQSPGVSMSKASNRRNSVAMFLSSPAIHSLPVNQQINDSILEDEAMDLTLQSLPDSEANVSMDLVTTTATQETMDLISSQPTQSQSSLGEIDHADIPRSSSWESTQSGEMLSQTSNDDTINKFFNSPVPHSNIAESSLKKEMTSTPVKDTSMDPKSMGHTSSPLTRSRRKALGIETASLEPSPVKCSPVKRGSSRRKSVAPSPGRKTDSTPRNRSSDVANTPKCSFSSSPEMASATPNQVKPVSHVVLDSPLVNVESADLSKKDSKTGSTGPLNHVIDQVLPDDILDELDLKPPGLSDSIPEQSETSR